MLRTLRWATVAVLAVLVGCTDAAKAPAEAAIKAGEAAIEGVRAEATKLVPDEMKALDAGLARAKDQFRKGEYEPALETAKDLAGKAKDLGAAAAAKRSELAKSWEEVSGSVQQKIEVIESRLGVLSRAKRLPAGLDAKELRAAEEGLAGLIRSFDEAAAKFEAGELQEAVPAARSAEDRAAELMSKLGTSARLEPPARRRSPGASTAAAPRPRPGRWPRGPEPARAGIGGRPTPRSGHLDGR